MANPHPFGTDSLANGGARLAALRAADILHADPEASYDMLARFAADTCEVPIGLINFIGDDRQWTKGNCGLPGLDELPLDVAFCPHTIAGSGILEVPDTQLDARFVANPLVTQEPFIRYYAGAPLLAKNGLALGALCVLDRKPNLLSERQRRDLVALAALVSEIVAMRAVIGEGLRSRVRWLSEALEHTATPLVIMEQAAPEEPPRCSYANRAFSQQFGIPASRLIGSNPIEIVAGPKTDLSAFAEFGKLENRERPAQVEIVIYGGDGTEHIVELTRRPVLGHGAVTAWINSVTDVTSQRASAAEIAKHAERLRSLYTITNMRGMTGYRQVDTVIELGLRSLELDYGFVVRCANDVATIVNSVGGDERPTKVGDFVPMSDLLLREAFVANDVRAFEDLSVQRRADGTERQPGWGAYIVAPISVGDERFGVIGFMGKRSRETPFTEADREFVRLIGAFVGPSLERKAQKDRLDELAFRDALTGLNNRAMLFERLEAILGKSRRGDSQIALLYVDLDDFKTVNDGGGHAAGDTVLIDVAKRLCENVREGDVVARIGGDEFVVVQESIDSAQDSEALAHRLIDAIRKPYVACDRTFTIGASIGIALTSKGISTASALLESADRALYEAKALTKGSSRTIDMRAA